MKKAEEMYKKYNGIIKARATSFHRSTGRDIDDFLSAGNEVFMETLSLHDENKANFGTLLFLRLNNRFSDMVKKPRPLAAIHLDWIEDEREQDPINLINFKDILEHMSKEAKYVVNIVLDAPGEVLDIVGGEPPKMIRGAIVRYLRKKKWKWNDIWNTFNEIKQVLKTA